MTERKSDGERTRLRRHPERGSHERELIHAILDAAYVCHVGFTDAGGPVVLPMAYARVGERLYLHGAVNNRMLEALCEKPACVTVTLLDGLVFARSQFAHSMNYRSVVVFGRARPIEAQGPKLEALAALVERMAPGRSREARAPTPSELRATRVLELPIDEASAKVRRGPPVDHTDDHASPCWAGVVPIEERLGAPVPAPELGDVPPSPSVLRARGARDA